RTCGAAGHRRRVHPVRLVRRALPARHAAAGGARGERGGGGRGRRTRCRVEGRMRQYVLVGSGIAALSAAESLRETDPRARITLVSSESHPFYSRPGLAYFLTGEVPERRLAIRRRAELADLRVERIHGTAARVDTAAHRLHLDDGRSLAYDRLLLAPGAASVPPEFEGAELE